MLENILQYWEENKSTLLLWSAVLFLIAVAALTFWLFFFNRGTLRVTSEPPFTIQIPEIENTYCEQSACDLPIAVGSYQVAILKPGFETYSIEAVIERGKVTEVIPKFKYVPEVSVEANRWNFELSRDMPQQFQGLSLFDDLPVMETMSELIGDFDNDFYLWSQTNGRFYFVDKDDETLNHALFAQTTNGQKERITIFPRDIENGFLAINATKKKIVMVDTTSNNNQIYVIDLETKSKKKVAAADDVRRVNWTMSDDLILENVIDGEVKLNLINVESAKIEELPFESDFENVTSKSSGEILFIAGRVADLVSQNGESPGNTPESGVFLNEYNPKTGEINLLVNIQNTLRSFPERIEISNDEKAVRILSSGLLFDVKLSL